MRKQQLIFMVTECLAIFGAMWTENKEIMIVAFLILLTITTVLAIMDIVTFNEKEQKKFDAFIRRMKN